MNSLKSDNKEFLYESNLCMGYIKNPKKALYGYTEWFYPSFEKIYYVK